MAAVVLALASALCYGMSDFFGGVLSKTRSVWMVTAVSQMIAGCVTLIIALATPGDPRVGDFVWASGAGAAIAVGAFFLYEGLSHGRMGVVAPISGIGSVLVPIIVGLGTGDEPSLLAWIAIALVFPAIYFIPQAGEHPVTAQTEPGETPSGAIYGVIAGLAFGAVFALVGQIGDNSGFLPLAWLQLVAGLAVAIGALIMRQPWVPRGSDVLPLLGLGFLNAVSLCFFLLATRQDMLTVVSVIAALYPASTVAIAVVVLNERGSRKQIVGLGLAVIVVVLLTVG